MHEHKPLQPELFWLQTLPELQRYAGMDFHIEQDETAVSITAADHQHTWLHIRLRDRRHDGTPTPQGRLSQDWLYDKPIDAPPPHAVEQSIYWGDPASPLESQYPTPLATFINNPFTAIPTTNNPGDFAVYAQLFHMVYGETAPPRPGAMSVHSPKLYSRLQPHIEQVARDSRFHNLSAMPSWYHVAKMFERYGFTYWDGSDADQMALLDERVAGLGSSHASWLVTLQFFNQTVEAFGEKPEEYVGSNFVLRDQDGRIINFPLSYDRSLWMNKPL